ncbi:hypothetical protein DFJ74DRAFT_714194 [Hyaloraphidium curvatum]|nr:hypothetical protein DFJ74DRAFT_714194 [Hyaloraphidium curvatum]
MAVDSGASNALDVADPAPILALPPEMLAKVFSWLRADGNPAPLAVCRTVSKYFCEVASPVLVESVRVRWSSRAAGLALPASRWAASVKNLRLESLDDCDGFLRAFPNVRKLHMDLHVSALEDPAGALLGLAGLEELVLCLEEGGAECLSRLRFPSSVVSLALHDVWFEGLPADALPAVESDCPFLRTLEVSSNATHGMGRFMSRLGADHPRLLGCLAAFEGPTSALARETALSPLFRPGELALWAPLYPPLPGHPEWWADAAERWDVRCLRLSNLSTGVLRRGVPRTEALEVDVTGTGTLGIGKTEIPRVEAMLRVRARRIEVPGLGSLLGYFAEGTDEAEEVRMWERLADRGRS